MKRGRSEDQPGDEFSLKLPNFRSTTCPAGEQFDDFRR
jgi:hypothetical protein